MTSRVDKPRHVDPDTPADGGLERKPMPLPEGRPGNDGSDPAPESEIEPGLFKPLENTPAVRGPEAEATGGNPHARRDPHSDPLGTKANTTVNPTTEVPGAKRPPPR